VEIPGSVYFEHPGEHWSIHLNHDRGFRDVFDSGAEHAIILGDSFTRGTSVHDHQTIPYLLDLWTPEIAFHSFAIGGSGTVDAYRAYGAVGDDWDHLSEKIKELGARRLHGEADKHLNAFGAYAAASSIYEWMQRDWPKGPKTMRAAPPFEDGSWGITRPDCGLVDRYRERLLHPVSNADSAPTA
jgi:hypothetical protein